MITSKRLHYEAFVLDSHCDTPLRLIRGIDIGKRTKEGHVDFVRMKEGGVDASFFAIYTSNSLSPDESTRRAFELIAHTYDIIDKYPEIVSLATTVKQGMALKEKGLIAIYLGMENGAPIRNDLSLLRLFYKMGIRYMTLTHAGNNLICDSCATKEKRWGGVSPFGRRVIAEMNRLGMIVDVSHISDEAFYDVLKYSKAPVVATHSCCRALANLPRNMTDQMIIDLAAAGGVIQINFYPAFINDLYADKFWPLADEFEAAEKQMWKHPRRKSLIDLYQEKRQNLFALKRPSYKELVDHIEHAVKLVGAKHVGIGSDFDGIETTPEGLEDISKMGVITKEMRERGFSDNDIKLILGGNFMRLFKEVENLKTK
jgi:membrane dipeptidase